MNLVVTIEDLQDINKATFEAFLETGRYAFSKRGANEQFGRVLMDKIIEEKLLTNKSRLPGKAKYLLSDIIAAINLLEKKEKEESGKQA